MLSKRHFEIAGFSVRHYIAVNGFGYSAGEYAMVELTFRLIADKREIKYTQEDFDFDTSLCL